MVDGLVFLTRNELAHNEAARPRHRRPPGLDRLQRLGAALMSQGKGLDRSSAGAGRGQPDRGRALVWAERLYAERRHRDALFPADLFGEPAWDLLLKLFAAREQGQNMILSQAYRAARVSDTTGRRLLDQLEKEGMITRRRTPRSRKTRLVELTDDAVERLIDYLAN
jgi:DNA-binding MarR family transcriptional regulator